MKQSPPKVLIVLGLVLLPLAGSANDLVYACGAKGWTPDFGTGDCFNPKNPKERARPADLWPAFQSPTPRDSNGDLVYQCGRIGKSPDFATGQCR